jgi:[ribosomal protein S5]-alanine N-acetyltransferase
VGDRPELQRRLPMTEFDWGTSLPTLRGARVTLRALLDADVDDLYAAFSDPEVMRYWDVPPMPSVADAVTFLAEIHEGFRTRTLFQWGVDAGTGQIVGTCTLLNVNTTHRRGEIGFALARPHWGQGLASDAVATLIGFCFRDLALHLLEADVDPRNERSKRLLERQGFVREGYLRERYQVSGEIQDAVLLGLLRRDWLTSSDVPFNRS